ncbi:hypothetical protein [Streptomyces sp. AC495_CC817]|uniref:hypothetical protein n=1 Tax=Streptomyces sp. AC495_CC817 TaxID=2823900 RepID=UPI001C267CF8|nr:hypothetical protein [Streptomyces sp. AC495_CC817]
MASATPWTDMSGFSCKDARFTAMPGVRAGATADRPQLDHAGASGHPVAKYLPGKDGWAPHRGRAGH